MATETEAEAENANVNANGKRRRPTMKERFRGANAGSQLKTGAGSVAGILATIVTVITAIAAAILVLHIVFVLFKGNPSNTFVSHIADYADNLAGFFKDLFTFKNPKTNTLINYGVAALVWVGVGRLIASLLQRIKT